MDAVYRLSLQMVDPINYQCMAEDTFVNLNKKRVVLVLTSLILTFVTLRIYLHLFPGTNLDIGGYNIHHLFTGLLLITLGGLPLAIFHGSSRKLDLASVVFGAGLSMALDEWVYLIATDGSDVSYLLPISFWGAVVMISLALGYALTMVIIAYRCERGTEADQLMQKPLGREVK